MKFLKGLWRRLGEHRTAAGIICLAVLAGISGWRRMTPPPEPGPLPPAAAVGADYSLERFVLTVLADSGRPGVILSGVGMTHDPGAGRSRVEQPEATMTGPDGVHWEASARRGWVDDDGRRVELEGEVEMIRRETETAPLLRLQTETLRLYPERNQARSPAHVTLTQPGARLQGRGLLVDLARGRYELKADVRGRYDVPDED